MFSDSAYPLVSMQFSFSIVKLLLLPQASVFADAPPLLMVCPSIFIFSVGASL
ncbi:MULTISPECIES: hypothetical protein [Niallia]|uniref:hypothetical protein n=1 Tax=Niallia TaxID=2837506 RepID=UPI0013D488E2|nr:hypothetical protein [Niallia circulans]